MQRYRALQRCTICAASLLFMGTAGLFWNFDVYLHLHEQVNQGATSGALIFLVSHYHSGFIRKPQVYCKDKICECFHESQSLFKPSFIFPDYELYELRLAQSITLVSLSLNVSHSLILLSWNARLFNKMFLLFCATCCPPDSIKKRICFVKIVRVVVYSLTCITCVSFCFSTFAWQGVSYTLC